MNNLLNSSTIPAWFLLAVSIILGVLYLLSRVRREDLQTLRDSNQDLRDAINDNNKHIAQLETKVNMLGDQVKILNTQNSEMIDLIVRALTIYFHDNPAIAQLMQGKVEAEKVK